MRYIVISEDGDIVVQSEVTQEDLAGFDQSIVHAILRVSLGNPGDGEPNIEKLTTVDSEDADDETPDDEHFDGQKYKAVDWVDVG